MSRIAVPAEVETILGWWWPRVRSVLGDKIASVVLYGSVTLGDFAAGWSDVDVCVVLREGVSDDEGRGIGEVHDAMLDRYVGQGAEGWRSGQVIEGPYVPIGLAVDAEVVDWCYVAGGATRKLFQGNPITPFDRYMLANFGVCWFGEEVVFAEPTRESLRGQLCEDLRSIEEPSEACLNSSIWLAGIVHWIARSMVFWRDGVMLSKTAALEREIAAGGAFAGAYELALRMRREGSRATADHLEALRENFLHIAGPAARGMRDAATS